MSRDLSSSQSSVGPDFMHDLPTLVTSANTHSTSTMGVIAKMRRRHEAGAAATSISPIERSPSAPVISEKAGVGGAMARFLSSGMLKLVASVSSHTRSVSHTSDTMSSRTMSVSVSSPESKVSSTSGGPMSNTLRSLFRKKSSQLENAPQPTVTSDSTSDMILCRHLSHETTASSASGLCEPTPQVRASPLLSTTKPVTPLVMASVSHTEMAELERIVDVPLFPVQIAMEESVIFDDLTDFFSHMIGSLSPTVLQRLLTLTAGRMKKMVCKSPSKKKRSRTKSTERSFDTALVMPVFNPELWTVFAGLFDSLCRLLNEELIPEPAGMGDRELSDVFDEDGLCLSVDGSDVVTPAGLPPGFGRMMTLPGIPIHMEAARLEDSLCVDSEFTEERSEFWMLDDGEPEEKPEEKWDTLCSGILDLLIEELRQFGLGECHECLSVDWSVICDFATALVDSCYEIELDKISGFSEHHSHSIKMFYFTIAMRAWIQHRDDHYNSGHQGRMLPPPKSLVGSSSVLSTTIEKSEELSCTEDEYAAAPPKPSAIKAECCRCSRRAMQAHLAWEKLIR